MGGATKQKSLQRVLRAHFGYRHKESTDRVLMTDYTGEGEECTVAYRVYYHTSGDYRIVRVVFLKGTQCYRVEVSHAKFSTPAQIEARQWPNESYADVPGDGRVPYNFTKQSYIRMLRQVAQCYLDTNQTVPSRLRTIIRGHGGTVPTRQISTQNPATVSGRFTSTKPNIEEQFKEEKTMNIDSKTILALQSQQGVKTVVVKFNKEAEVLNERFNDEEAGFSKGTYVYKTTLDLKPGDIVLCQARGWFKVAKVIEVHEVADMSEADNSMRWVLSVLNDEVALSQKLDQSEKDIERNLANARALREAREMMKEAGVEDLDGLVSVPTMSDVRQVKQLADDTVAGGTVA